MQRRFASGTASLTCIVEGLPDCDKVEWIGPAITSGPDSRVEQSRNLGLSLTIRELTVGDQGSYFCRCGEATSQPMTLEVLSKSAH